ncbi:sensor domain-containing diguanylate cyclase [Pseudodesulfovibrio sp. JC047]|uniref:sensor domain-containing diguanylate cyclase n=1 Tax=Pseudodesulfovibrio sp. JC047 TaxID=2683199 RepID=UPI0013D0AAC8|nr:sensor domain-containing diguanylate cyclase [Pseudodesulfovibrio sp. JC047]
MDRLEQYIQDNEEWLKKRVLAYIQAHEKGSDVAGTAWDSFFSELVDTLPRGVSASIDPDWEREKEAILTLFQQLDTPAFILDESMDILNVNARAGAVLSLDTVLFETRQSLSLEEAVPWLASGIRKICLTGMEKSGGNRTDVVVPTRYGEKHLTLSVVRLGDVCVGCPGYAVTVDDISFRVETERQLSRERNRVAHYLDVVGSIVVAQDASGAITMMNRTGCEHLGYEKHELLGKNWVDLFIPDSLRDEVRDYLYMIFSGQTEIEDEHINYIVDKNGARRLIHWRNRVLTNESGMIVGVLSSGMDITEQRAMEDALAEKELWLRNTFVALGEAVLIVTPDQIILDANPAAETMFGLSNEELSGTPVASLHTDAAQYEAFLVKSRTAFDKGEKARFEMPLRRSDGEEFPADYSASLILGDDNLPLGIVNVIRDESARKKAERVLLESEEKFRRIFESIEEGYMVTDLDGTIQMVNPATCRLLGEKESALLGKSIDSLYLIKDERAGLRRQLVEKGVTRGFQIQIQRKDGAVIVIEANAHLIRNEQGNVEAFEGTFRDITNRIEAEKVLLEREKQYRAFFENNHAIMLLVDPRTERIIDANPAASDFYGYSVDAMRAMTMDQINVLSQEDVFREMQLSREESRAYFIMKHALKGGDVRDVEVYSGPIMVQGQQRLYSVIHDVTQRIRLEQELKQLATIDSLTGASNRHHFLILASKELARAKRYDNPLTVFMLDIDYFKSINDTHGHQAGDQVLKGLSVASVETLRENDIFGRLGGEEFAVVLPETPLQKGIEVAERLRTIYASLETVAGGERIPFTVSFGVTAARPSDRNIEEVLNRADEALYKAKRMGRNRVEQG